MTRQPRNVGPPPGATGAVALDDRGSSPAIVAGWLVMGLFLLVGILTVLLGVSAAAYENVFLGIIVPMAVVALVVGILLLLRGR